jgi:hypothetical protein
MDTPDAGPEFYTAPGTPVGAGVTPAQRLSLSARNWRGAKRGFRWVSYVAVPICGLLLISSLFFTTYGLGTGRGFAVHPFVVGAIAFYLALALLGAAVGAVISAVIGLFVSLITWERAYLRPKKLCGSADQSPGRVAQDEPNADSPVEAPAQQSSARRPGRWRRRWLGLLAVPVAAIFVFGFVSGVRDGRRVDRELASAIASTDREDPAWRLRDLMAGRKAIPDAENSAMVVAKAAALLPDSWPGKPPSRWVDPQAKSSEAVQAFERLEATEPNIRLDDATAATLRKQLDLHEDAVQLARTVANYRRGRHELVIAPNPLDTSFKETAGARTVARLLAADAAIRAQDGDIDGALDSSRAILCVDRSIGDEPFLISGLVRISIGGIAMKSARRALAQGEPSDAALAKLQALALDEMAEPLLIQGFRGERAMLDVTIRRVRGGEISLSAVTGGSGTSVNGLFPADSPWGRLTFDKQRAAGLRWMNELISIARLPPSARAQRVKAWQADVDKVRSSDYGMFQPTLLLALLHPIVDVYDSHCRYPTELRALAILLAAERHRQKRGTWPKSIAEIDPAILSSPPLHPFSGEPLRVRQDENEFLVYSIGTNLRDEHGLNEPMMWRQGELDDYRAGAYAVRLRRRATVE